MPLCTQHRVNRESTLCTAQVEGVVCKRSNSSLPFHSLTNMIFRASRFRRKRTRRSSASYGTGGTSNYNNIIIIDVKINT